MAETSQVLEGASSTDRPPPPQLPEGGFDHPFHEPRWHLGATHEKQHPRTVSRDPPPDATFSFIFVSDRRAADVYSLQSYQGKAELVGEGEGRDDRWAMERRGPTTSTEQLG
jgi:hypothetical protein